VLHNGDGLCYYDLQKELVGLQINRAEPINAQARPLARVPEGPDGRPQGPAPGVEVNRNRDMDWVRGWRRSPPSGASASGWPG
jgi:hypothetical protein